MLSSSKSTGVTTSTSEFTQELANLVTTSLPVGIFLVSHDGVIAYSNNKAGEIFGYETEDLTGLMIEELVPFKHRDAHLKHRNHYNASRYNTAMNRGRMVSGLRKDGVEIELQIGLTTASDKYTAVSFIESTNTIIKPSSSNDPLTGLPNRRMFHEYSETLRKLAVRHNKDISILFIDLDNFKTINDQYGHEVGDKLLCQLTSLLQGYLRESDIIARAGGDEFIMCLYDVDNIAALNHIATKLVREISRIDVPQVTDHAFGASIGGVVSFSPQSCSIDEMISIADKLMYDVKRAGKGGVKTTQVGNE